MNQPQSLQEHVIELTSKEGESNCHAPLTKPIEDGESYSVALTKISSSLLFDNITHPIPAHLIVFSVIIKKGVPLDPVPDADADPPIIRITRKGIGLIKRVKIDIAEVIAPSRYNTMEHISIEFNRNISAALERAGYPRDALRLAYNGTHYEFQSKKMWSASNEPGKEWEIYDYFVLDPESESNKRLERLFDYNPADFRATLQYIDQKTKSLSPHASTPIRRRVAPYHPLSTYLMCVYCNVIEYGNFGDKKVPLLRTFPLPPTEIFTQDLNPPQYHRVNVKKITDLEISLTNELGEIMPAVSGRLNATLHFKPNITSVVN